MSDPGVSGSVSSAPETLAGSPGAVLRRCREFHGITFEEASETTKISISYLKALEDDQVREFANQAYLKGYLRIYATYLGLNSDDVARMYDKLSGVQSEKPDPARTSATSIQPPRRRISLKNMLLPALLLVAILITATFFRPTPPVVRQPPPAVVVAPPPQNAAVQAVQSSVRTRKAEQNDIPAPKEQRRPAESIDSEKTVTLQQPANAANGFILKIQVTQNGTLTSTVDGSGPQQYELTIGDVIEWKAEKKVTLELSNAGGVDVELNGKPYKAFGPPGKPAYIELDADGIIQ
jgi:cytoskeleton protein RodZ